MLFVGEAWRGGKQQPPHTSHILRGCRHFSKVRENGKREGGARWPRMLVFLEGCVTRLACGSGSIYVRTCMHIFVHFYVHLVTRGEGEKRETGKRRGPSTKQGAKNRTSWNGLGFFSCVCTYKRKYVLLVIEGQRKEVRPRSAYVLLRGKVPEQTELRRIRVLVGFSLSPSASKARLEEGFTGRGIVFGDDVCVCVCRSVGERGKTRERVYLCPRVTGCSKAGRTTHSRTR